MAESIRSHDASSVPQQRFVITNNYGEKLVAVLHETGSKKLVILCHGFRATKDHEIILNLSDAITNKDISVVRFDFSGNGESEGTFEYGNYWKEVEDLHSVLLYFSEKDYETSAVVGHSKGGDVVLLYASKYVDAHTVINLSGRFDLKRGIENVLGEDYLQRIKRDGFIDVMDKNGKFAFRVTEQSLMDRLNIDMHAACLSIDKKCRSTTKSIWSTDTCILNMKSLLSIFDWNILTEGECVEVYLKVLADKGMNGDRAYYPSIFYTPDFPGMLEVMGPDAFVHTVKTNVNNGFRYIFCPLNHDLSKHFHLVVFDIEKHEIIHYNSVSRKDVYLEHSNYVITIFQRMKKSLYDKWDPALHGQMFARPFTVRELGVPKQISSYDCAFLILRYIELLYYGVTQKFTQRHMKAYRFAIGNKIMRHSFFKPPV